MKLFKYGLPFAALALLASCANDNVVDQPDPTPEPEVAGTYLAFNIAATPTTKGVEDAVGMDQESKVKNVWLYLYRSDKSQTADDATLWKEIEMANPTLGDDNNTSHSGDPVSKIITATFQIKDMEAGDKDKYNFYAFVIVNKNEDLTVPQENQKFSDWYGTQTTANTAYTSATTWTTTNAHAIGKVTGNDLAKVDFVNGPEGGTPVNDMILVDNEKPYFTMTSAPIIDDDKEEISILAEVDASKFKVSPTQAAEAATTVFVQRGVAKVLVKETSPSTGHPISEASGAGYASATLTIDNWALDVLNTSTYPVQHVEKVSEFGTDKAWAPDYFIGSLASHGDGNRIFWAIDPEYFNEAYTQKPANNLYLSAIENKWNDLSDVEYCLENTMDFDKMQKNQSTQVIFKTTIKLDGSEGGSFIYYPGSDLAYLLTSQDKVQDDAAAGKLKISALTTDTETKNRILANVNALNDEQEVYYYPQGVSYYTAIIRHFVEGNQPGSAANDRDVKYLNETAAGANKVDTPHPNYYTADDLGRYGVVRNNVYILKVGTVVGFGSPTVPQPGPEPNDNPDPLKYNIKLNIEVLNWSVRDHDYTIK